MRNRFYFPPALVTEKCSVHQTGDCNLEIRLYLGPGLQNVSCIHHHDGTERPHLFPSLVLHLLGQGGEDQCHRHQDLRLLLLRDGGGGRLPDGPGVRKL